MNYKNCSKQIIMDEYSDSVLNAKIFANEFFKITRDLTTPNREDNTKSKLLRLKYSKNLVNFLSRIRSSVVRGNCDGKTFKEKIIKQSNIKYFDLETLWYLMKCELMDVNDLLLMCDNLFHSQNLSSSLFNNIFLQSEQSACFRIDVNSDFLELLLRHKEKCENDGSQSAAYNYFLHQISAHEMDGDDAGFLTHTDLFVDSINVALLKDSKIKLFILDLIKILLQGKFISLQDVFYKNEHFLKYETSLCTKSCKILNFIDLDDMIIFLKQFLSENSNTLNWENFFLLLTSMTCNYEQVNLFKQLKALIQFLLENAFELYNESLLLYAFFIARHCSFPTTPHFPSYLQWFSSTFSSESVRPINTKERSVFFINFLSDIVQYDSPYYMKIHINKVPWLPIECQSLLSNYVNLVKTRLIDLNESTELGLFDNMIADSSAEYDVETTLNIFSSTNEIPKCVLEASFFCKSYYEKRFLATLLSKSEGKYSVRHKLITKLHSLGKIPPSLFLKYKELL